jgi:hypothetical protein
VQESRRSTHVTKSQKLVISMAVAAVALFGAAVQAPRASAATPCWKVLLTDWYDGRIDHTYPLHCYTDALSHLPPDVSTYSSAHDDIFRALQTAKAKLRSEGKAVTPTTPIPANGGGNPKPSTTTSTTTSTDGETTTNEPGNSSSGPVQDLNTSGPLSVPLPLLILGGLAILLIAAGAVGFFVRRHQNRPPPAAS